MTDITDLSMTYIGKNANEFNSTVDCVEMTQSSIFSKVQGKFANGSCTAAALIFLRQLNNSIWNVMNSERAVFFNFDHGEQCLSKGKSCSK